jgi:hypothetical protein
MKIPVKRRITIYVDRKFYCEAFISASGYADWVNKAIMLAYEAGQRSGSTNYYWSSEPPKESTH